MINERDFATINDEVQTAINEVLDHLRANSPQNYVLFLADGEFRKEYTKKQPKLNPYVIDYRFDRYDDETRLNFLVEFLQTFYRFPPGNNIVDNSPIRLNMELMIYMHIWEARPFLKRLYRMAILSNGGEYQWEVIVPAMAKHDFIRIQTRDVFNSNHFQIAQTITSGYHSSLRNAFAHAEYSFDLKDNFIWLSNYRRKGWELRNISFDDWSRRFAYSVLLNYHLLNIIHLKRQAVNRDLNTHRHTIRHITQNNETRDVTILYDAENDSFRFER